MCILSNEDTSLKRRKHMHSNLFSAEHSDNSLHHQNYSKDGIEKSFHQTQQNQLFDKCMYHPINRSLDANSQFEREMQEKKFQLETPQIPIQKIANERSVTGSYRFISDSFLFCGRLIHEGHNLYSYVVPRNREGKVKRKKRRKIRQSSNYRPALFKPSLETVLEHDQSSIIYPRTILSESCINLSVVNMRSNNEAFLHYMNANAKMKIQPIHVNKILTRKGELNLNLNPSSLNSSLKASNIIEKGKSTIIQSISSSKQFPANNNSRQRESIYYNSNLDKKMTYSQNVNHNTIEIPSEQMTMRNKYLKWFQVYKCDDQYYDLLKKFTGHFARDMFRAVNSRNLNMLKLVKKSIDDSSKEGKSNDNLTSLRNTNGHDLLTVAVRNRWFKGTKFFVTNGWEIHTNVLNIALHRSRDLKIYRYLIDRKQTQRPNQQELNLSLLAQ